jgi:hypothetical protein
MDAVVAASDYVSCIVSFLLPEPLANITSTAPTFVSHGRYSFDGFPYHS